MTRPLAAAFASVVADAGVFCSAWCLRTRLRCGSCRRLHDDMVTDLLAAATSHADTHRREVIDISGLRIDVIDAAAFPARTF